MKSLAALLAAIALAGCATQETAPTDSQQPTGAKRECVRRTGSNICSKDDTSALPAAATLARL